MIEKGMILIWQDGSSEHRSTYCRFDVPCTASRRIVSHH